MDHGADCRSSFDLRNSNVEFVCDQKEKIDAVCSPGGSTIVGVEELENGAFRGTVANAVVSAYEKTKKLGE